MLYINETYINCLKQIFQIQILKKILTDKNTAFTTSRYNKVLYYNNAKGLLILANHAQTNDKVERLNQIIRLKWFFKKDIMKIP